MRLATHNTSLVSRPYPSFQSKFVSKLWRKLRRKTWEGFACDTAPPWSWLDTHVQYNYRTLLVCQSTSSCPRIIQGPSHPILNRVPPELRWQSRNYPRTNNPLGTPVSEYPTTLELHRQFWDYPRTTGPPWDPCVRVSHNTGVSQMTSVL